MTTLAAHFGVATVLRQPGIDLALRPRAPKNSSVGASERGSRYLSNREAQDQNPYTVLRVRWRTPSA